MLTLAGIFYQIDQDEPSDPFLFEVENANTREGLEQSLRAYVAAELNGENNSVTEIGSFEWFGQYGDICVELKSSNFGNYLIVGLPDDLKDKLKSENPKTVKFLKDLADTLMRLPACYGTDQYHVDRLLWIAEKMKNDTFAFDEEFADDDDDDDEY